VNAVVFLGPSIPKARLPRVPFEIRPPVQQGDVLCALADGAKRIGIIDGYFDQVPSVWHKEILFAIEQGATVFGAASMGALRAAELHAFGMIGVGRIFEMFRDGVLEDDDEVALLHSSAEHGYRSLSEAMVNLRDLADASVAANVIGSAEAATAIAKLKALPYPQRSIRKFVDLAPSLATFVKEPRTPLKERDALALLERMQSDVDRPIAEPKRARVERSIFFERLRQEIAKERSAPVDEAERRRRRDALLALLATKHALRSGATPTTEDIDAVLRERPTTLATNEELEAFVDEARSEATVRRLELVYESEIARRR
jgi:hypothetical protein